MKPFRPAAPRGGIGLVDAHGRIGGFWLGLAVLADRLQLAGKRQRLGQLDDLHGLGRIGGDDGRSRIVIGNLRRRGVPRAAREGGSGKQESRE
jgi:hypothetical protein